MGNISKTFKNDKELVSKVHIALVITNYLLQIKAFKIPVSKTLLKNRKFGHQLTQFGHGSFLGRRLQVWRLALEFR